MHKNSVEGKNNMPLETTQSKAIGYNEDTNKLIAEISVIENSIRNDTLEIFNLNRFYLLINTPILCRIRYLDFTACKRKI